MGAKIVAILWTVLYLFSVESYLVLLAIDVMIYQSATTGAKITAILWIVVDLVFFTGYVALLAIDVWMVHEVNRSVTEGRRLDYWEWSWETPKVEPLHKELFPNSKLRLASNIIAWVWLPFALIGFWRVRQVVYEWTW